MQRSRRVGGPVIIIVGSIVNCLPVFFRVALPVVRVRGPAGQVLDADGRRVRYVSGRQVLYASTRHQFDGVGHFLVVVAVVTHVEGGALVVWPDGVLGKAVRRQVEGSARERHVVGGGAVGRDHAYPRHPVEIFRHFAPDIVLFPLRYRLGTARIAVSLSMVAYHRYLSVAVGTFARASNLVGAMDPDVGALVGAFQFEGVPCFDAASVDVHVAKKTRRFYAAVARAANERAAVAHPVPFALQAQVVGRPLNICAGVVLVADLSGDLRDQPKPVRKPKQKNAEAHCRLFSLVH